MIEQPRSYSVSSHVTSRKDPGDDEGCGHEDGMKGLVDCLGPDDNSIWKVGMNCGVYVGRLGQSCLQAQSQVLICNAVANAKALPQELMKGVLERFQPDAGKGRQSLAIRFAASLLAMSAATVEKVWSLVQKANWRPESRLLLQGCFFPQTVWPH